MFKAKLARLLAVAVVVAVAVLGEGEPSTPPKGPNPIAPNGCRAPSDMNGN